jgi:putative ABC transport system substrate-binding protein
MTQAEWVSVESTNRMKLFRSSIAFLALTALTYAAFAREGPARIALVIPGPLNCVKDALTLPAMRESGIDPETVQQYCYSELKDIPEQMRKIVLTKPDVLLIFASAVAARAAREASPTLPIVFADVQDPVKNGLAKSLAHPGLNMTGITNNSDELLGKRIEVIKEALPEVRRIALLVNLSNEGQQVYLRIAQDAARMLRIDAKPYDVRSSAELDAAFAAMEQDRMQVVLLLPDAWFFSHRVDLVTLSASHHVPLVTGNTVYGELGGLLTYGANLSAMAKRAWLYVHKILDGANPSELPAEQPVELDFIVNAKTAREQGIKISPTAMLRASRVIE